MDEVNAWSILSSKWTIVTGIVMALCAVITAVISSAKKDKTGDGGKLIATNGE